MAGHDAKRSAAESPGSMATQSEKRICLPSQGSSRTHSQDANPIIGLDVCGKVYYCRQSTLVKASPYFEARFKGNFDTNLSFVDTHGRKVYFVERPSATFQYIFDYIVSGRMQSFPCFQDNPSLIRNLRNEADYFGLDKLCEQLKVTKSFVPEEDNRGLLYWLGTKKGTADYQNPFTIGAVHIGGWMDDITNKRNCSNYEKAAPAHCRASFVEYQGPVDVAILGREKLASETLHAQSNHDIFGSSRSDAVDIKLNAVMGIRPTHFSLRAGCERRHGMWTGWSFVGSVDGLKWDALYTGGSGNERVRLDEDHPYLQAARNVEDDHRIDRPDPADFTNP